MLSSFMRRIPASLCSHRCYQVVPREAASFQSAKAWKIVCNFYSSDQSTNVLQRGSPPSENSKSCTVAQEKAMLEPRHAEQEVVVDGKVNYSYFKQIVSKIGKAPSSKGVVSIDPSVTDDVSLDIVPSKTTLQQVDAAQSNLLPIRPKKPDRSAALATYVNESETLTKLVQLKVDLSKVEKNSEVSNFLVKSDFEIDVKPYLLFLHKIGIIASDYGSVLTKAPEIFLDDLANLENRVNYFEAKRFDADSIRQIVTKCPKVLTTPVKETDGKLGFLQKLFDLSGAEVRQIVTRYPKVAVWHKITMQDISLTWQEFMGFSAVQRKHMALAYPKLLLEDKNSMRKRFDYVHNVMGFSHADIAAWPNVLRKRVRDIQERHLFLEHIGRAQYNPTLPNYVSLRALTTKRDIEFCNEVAKVPVKQYNEFLKTL